MQQYAWPGNVRELQNYIERAVVMATGDELTWELLPPEITSGRAPRVLGPRTMDFQSLAEELVQVGINGADDSTNNVHGQIVGHVEREVIAQVMSSCDNVQIKAASRLGINRNTLHKKLKQYGLETDASDN
jgi:DNA-binding NtrC family response regulator